MSNPGLNMNKTFIEKVENNLVLTFDKTIWFLSGFFEER